MTRPSGAKPFVLFDFGQTLVDLRGLVSSLATVVERLYPALANQSKDFAWEWMRLSASSLPRRENEPFAPEFQVVTEVLVGLLASDGVTIDPEKAGDLLRDAWDDFEKSVKFCPGISIEWLGEVRRISGGLALVTDGDNENIDRLVRRLKIRPLFDAIVTSEDAKVYKPQPRIYRAALRALHADPTRSLFISDAAIDLQGASALGMGTVLLEQSSVTEPKDLPPDCIRVANPLDLPRVLRQFAKRGSSPSSPA